MGFARGIPERKAEKIGRFPERIPLADINGSLFVSDDEDGVIYLVSNPETNK